MFFCSPQTVGVIIRLEKENFCILNMHDKLVNMKPNSIQKRRFNKFAVALDSENNSLSVNDIIKVTDGPHNVSIHKIWHFK